jgi:hypothetical protein
MMWHLGDNPLTVPKVCWRFYALRECEEKKAYDTTENKAKRAKRNSNRKKDNSIVKRRRSSGSSQFKYEIIRHSHSRSRTRGVADVVAEHRGGNDDYFAAIQAVGDYAMEDARCAQVQCELLAQQGLACTLACNLD